MHRFRSRHAINPNKAACTPSTHVSRSTPIAWNQPAAWRVMCVDREAGGGIRPMIVLLVGYARVFEGILLHHTRLHSFHFPRLAHNGTLCPRPQSIGRSIDQSIGRRLHWACECVGCIPLFPNPDNLTSPNNTLQPQSTHTGTQAAHPDQPAMRPSSSSSLGGLGAHRRQQPQQSAQPQQRECVRILVLGDERVGKSSLVSAFVSQCFPEKVQRRACLCVDRGCMNMCIKGGIPHSPVRVLR